MPSSNIKNLQPELDGYESELISHIYNFPRIIGIVTPRESIYSDNFDNHYFKNPITIFSKPSIRSRPVITLDSDNAIERRPIKPNLPGYCVYNKYKMWYNISITPPVHKEKRPIPIQGWIHQRHLENYYTITYLIKFNGAWVSPIWNGILFSSPNPECFFKRFVRRGPSYFIQQHEKQYFENSITSPPYIKVYKTRIRQNRYWIRFRFIMNKDFAINQEWNVSGWIPLYDANGQLNFEFF